MSLSNSNSVPAASHVSTPFVAPVSANVILSSLNSAYVVASESSPYAFRSRTLRLFCAARGDAISSNAANALESFTLKLELHILMVPCCRDEYFERGVHRDVE